MAELEKMVALKKAYAEIILNTAKEAACRVMESEKKAIRFREDLCRTKDEALRMLVRLKQMLDAKMIESEVKSSSQQGKIDVLEAQLQEAEGVIVDLRAELKWARDKLEKVRNNRFQLLNAEVIADKGSSMQNTIAEPVILPPNLGHQTVITSSTKNKLPNHTSSDRNCCDATEKAEKLSVLHRENYYSDDPNLASMNTTIKELELDTSRCTKRVCESDEKLLVAKLPSFDDQHSPRNEMMTASTSDEGICTVYTLKSKNIETEKKLSGEEVGKYVKVCSAHERKTSLGKDLKAEAYQTPSILSHCKTYSTNADSHIILPWKADNEDMKKVSNEQDQKLRLKRSCLMNETIYAHKEKKTRMEQIGNASSASFSAPPVPHSKVCQPFSLLNRCKTYSFLLHGNVKSNEDHSKMKGNEIKLKPLTRLDPGLTLIKGGMDPASGSTNVTSGDEAINSCDTTQFPVKEGTELPYGLPRQEVCVDENSKIPCWESNIETDNTSLVDSSTEDAKTSEETMVNVPLVYCGLENAKASKKPKVAPSEENNYGLPTNRCKRKRNKEALSRIDQNIIPEESTAKRKAEGKQNNASKPHKLSLVDESSRDSRQLALVAHQLISLSGKRWP